MNDDKKNEDVIITKSKEKEEQATGRGKAETGENNNCTTTSSDGQQGEESMNIKKESKSNNERKGTDPHLELPSDKVQEGDWVLLHFEDGKQIFAQALRQSRGKNPACKIHKRSYPTYALIGLPYGTVLQVKGNHLVPVHNHHTAKAINKYINDNNKEQPQPTTTSTNDNDVNIEKHSVVPRLNQIHDNRNLMDDNTSQRMKMQDVHKLRRDGVGGDDIIKLMIANSSTFATKTDYSKAKYIQRKQWKYTPTCRIIRTTGINMCRALYLQNSKKMLNLRHDTLGQLLSYANVAAGQAILIHDDVQGVLTGSLAQRMGGYGQIFSIYQGQQTAWVDILERFNLSFAEQYSIKWVHSYDVYGPPPETKSHASNKDDEEEDVEARDRNEIEWPCPLQSHTRRYLEQDVLGELESQQDKDEGKEKEHEKKDDETTTNGNGRKTSATKDSSSSHKIAGLKEVEMFMAKRCQRFARKLTRTTPIEVRNMLYNGINDDANDKNRHNGEMAKQQQANGKTTATVRDVQTCDAIICATKNDPTASVLCMLRFLKPSCPFVVYCEYLAPLAQLFWQLQQQQQQDTEDDDDDNDDDDDKNERENDVGDVSAAAAHRNDEKEETTVPNAPTEATTMNSKEESTIPSWPPPPPPVINLRLMDTWMREYQMLPGRTHPNMQMSQNGGYILLGTKLDPQYGQNELKESARRRIRKGMCGRRGNPPKHKKQQGGNQNNNKRKTEASEGAESKRCKSGED